MRSINEITASFLTMINRERIEPNDVPAVIKIWLQQPDVQTLLQAAWSPELRINREVSPYESVYEDPETGEVEQVRANVITVATVVGGTEYGKAITFAPDREPDEREILIAEIALRELLVEAAINGPKNTR